jgi:hypothetical protein
MGKEKVQGMKAGNKKSMEAEMPKSEGKAKVLQGARSPAAKIKEKEPAAVEERKPEMVEIISVHLAAPQPRKIARRKGGRSFFKSLLIKLGIIRKKPAERAVIPAEAPEEVREAIEETVRKKSKIEMMIKEKGPGWYGDRLRHQEAALKAWETRRKQDLVEQGRGAGEKKHRAGNGKNFRGSWEY